MFNLWKLTKANQKKLAWSRESRHEAWLYEMMECYFEFKNSWPNEQLNQVIHADRMAHKSSWDYGASWSRSEGYEYPNTQFWTQFNMARESAAHDTCKYQAFNLVPIQLSRLHAPFFVPSFSISSLKHHVTPIFGFGRRVAGRCGSLWWVNKSLTSNDNWTTRWPFDRSRLLRHIDREQYCWCEGLVDLYYLHGEHCYYDWVCWGTLLLRLGLLGSFPWITLPISRVGWPQCRYVFSTMPLPC